VLFQVRGDQFLFFSWRRYHAVGVGHWPLVTEAKIPTIVMVSAASIAVDRSPYIVRTSFTVGQSDLRRFGDSEKSG
jgi:hypothetical protein